MRRWALVGWLLASLGPAWAQASLGPEDVGTTMRIPAVGKVVTYTVRLREEVVRGLGGRAEVSFAVNGKVAQRQAVVLASESGQPRDVPFAWAPKADGWQRLSFSVGAPGAKVVQTVTRIVPVTAKPLYFVWFGAPRRFKWCNVPTTIDPRKAEEVAWWQWHGGLPCAWKGGVCYQEWTTEQFAESYRDSPWIAIDEVGPLDETGQKIMAAVRAHKQTHPEGARAIWFMGAHPYWRDFADCVDFFVPEIYLNYFGNHLGRFEPYLRITRAAGVTDRMIPGLGINIITDEQKRPTVTPTKADVLRQIRHLKTIAPELNGVGFFTSDSAAPGVAEYGDELCCEYYIKPVLTLVEGSLRARVKGKSLELTARLRNCGGMTAREPRVEVGRGYGPAFRTARQARSPKTLAPGQEATVSGVVALGRGIGAYGLRLPAQGGVTLLNERLWATAARGLSREGLALAQPVTGTGGGGMPLFADLGRTAGGGQVARLDDAGNVLEVSAATVVDSGRGRVLTWVPRALASGEPSHFSVRGGRQVEAVASMSARDGDALVVRGKGYAAVLDLARDQIVSLRAGETELLTGPWQFGCTAWEGFGVATVGETPAGVTVTAPLANDRAEGSSRYLFYRDAPVIRIARRLAPKGELKVSASSEGAGVPQRGGTYALQGGVGGPVQRGELHDSGDYRDLLFGHLGEEPGPYGADKAGWFDFAFTADGGGGLGVVIERRWEAAHSDVGYDVTRYYDGGDWLQVMNLWGKELIIDQPQTQIVYLVVHGPMDLTDERVVPPAQRLWDNLHQRAQPVVMAR